MVEDGGPECFLVRDSSRGGYVLVVNEKGGVTNYPIAEKPGNKLEFGLREYDDIWAVVAQARTADVFEGVGIAAAAFNFVPCRRQTIVVQAIAVIPLQICCTAACAVVTTVVILSSCVT